MQEAERSDLLEQYRQLSTDLERFETHSHQLESEGSTLKLELMTKDSELKRLRERVDGMDREIREVRLKQLLFMLLSYRWQHNSFQLCLICYYFHPKIHHKIAGQEVGMIVGHNTASLSASI